jgi:hypothetical protein
MPEKQGTPRKGRPEPTAEPKWVPGAEPIAICMSCNATYPLDLTHCPKCRVGLSVVRKCPSCERVQSVQHLVCIYCANSFMEESGLGRVDEGPAERRGGLTPGTYILVASGLAIVATIGALLHRQVKVYLGPRPVIGQSYMLEDASMRRKPALDSPVIKDLSRSKVVGITGFETDETGQRWFRVRDQGINGFVLTNEMAPPKTTDAENGYALLRHSLLGMDDPEVLPEATKALDYFRAKFPESPHWDELEWLLAEQMRALAPESSQQREILTGARRIYESLAAGNSEFSGSARQVLEQYPTVAEGNRARASSARRDTFGLSIVGGKSIPSQSPSSETVRKLTVVSRTPLVVSLENGVEVSSGTAFQGEIDREIRVHGEVAVPRGSVAHLEVVGSGASSSGVRVSPAFLRLSDVVIANHTYGVSAVAIRIDPPPGTGISSAPGANPRLPAGTRITFQLTEPLMVPQR